MYRRALGCVFVVTFSVLGCAGNVDGARPSDMSEQQHESAAAAHDREATEHARKYDPKALTEFDDCTEYLGSC